MGHTHTHPPAAPEKEITSSLSVSHSKKPPPHTRAYYCVRPALLPAPCGPTAFLSTVQTAAGKARAHARAHTHTHRHTHTEADLKSVHGEINIQQGHTRRVPCRATQNPPTPGLAGSGEKHGPQGSATCRPWSRGQLGATTGITWHLPAANTGLKQAQPGHCPASWPFPQAQRLI